MLNWLQYSHCNHDLIKTIHHESWNYKLMRNEMKILSLSKVLGIYWIDILLMIPFLDLKKNNFTINLFS